MPETELLDFTAEDVDEATCDQLVRGMADPYDDDPNTVITNCGGCGTSCTEDSCSSQCDEG